ncbi:MAG: hypothetical protein CMN76_05565 [Spirochaetaceae bacterium]|nr:hypothetical protein [Spirochaetaceae bacterium]
MGSVPIKLKALNGISRLHAGLKAFAFFNAPAIPVQWRARPLLFDHRAKGLAPKALAIWF